MLPGAFARLALALAALAPLAARAEAPPGPVERAPGEVALGLGLGAVTDAAQVGELLYLALEGGGLAVVDLSAPAAPVLRARIAPGRRFARLLPAGGALLAFEVRHEVTAFELSAAGPVEVPLERLRPGAVSSPPPAPRPDVAAIAPVVTASRAEGRLRVLEVRDGRALFEVLAGEVRRGDRVAVVSQRLVEKPDLLRGGTRAQPSNEVTAVLELEQVEAGRAMAELGRGDVARAGDLAEPTTRPLSERLLYPRRAPFNLRAGFFARPYLGLEAGTAGESSKPFGLLVDAYVAYYLEDLPIGVELSLLPAGVALGGRDPHRVATLAALVSYATDFFEIGLGAGGLLGVDGPCTELLSGEFFGCEENDGFTLAQSLRLGALDGIHLSFRSAVFSRPEAFVFGMGRGEVSIPLTSRLGLFGAGGGGENGWAFGELGVRTYLGGAGAAGTLVISASVGAAALFDGPGGNAGQEAVSGPSVGFGLEWRR